MEGYHSRHHGSTRHGHQRILDCASAIVGRLADGTADGEVSLLILHAEIDPASTEDDSEDPQVCEDRWRPVHSYSATARTSDFVKGFSNGAHEASRRGMNADWHAPAHRPGWMRSGFLT